MLIRPNDSTTGSLRVDAAEYPLTGDGMRDAFASQLDEWLFSPEMRGLGGEGE